MADWLAMQLTWICALRGTQKSGVPAVETPLLLIVADRETYVVVLRSTFKPILR